MFKGSLLYLILPFANEVCEGSVFTRVCLSTGGGGVSTWAGTPQAGTPPGRYTTQVGTPPWAGTPGQVHPHWAGTPKVGTPSGRYTPCPPPPLWAGTPPRRYTPRQVHTPGSSVCWEIRSTSGRYASYWNAFLFVF